MAWRWVAPPIPRVAPSRGAPHARPANRGSRSMDCARSQPQRTMRPPEKQPRHLAPISARAVPAMRKAFGSVGHARQALVQCFGALQPRSACRCPRRAGQNGEPGNTIGCRASGTRLPSMLPSDHAKQRRVHLCHQKTQSKRPSGASIALMSRGIAHDPCLFAGPRLRPFGVGPGIAGFAVWRGA